MPQLKTKSPTIDANVALYERIRGGDTSAINEMIESNTGLAQSRVGNFLNQYRRFTYLRDDLLSEAFLTLTKVVNSFVHSEAHRPTGRIGFEIDKRMGDYVDTEITAGMMSDRNLRRRRQGGNSLPNKLPIDINLPPAGLWFEADGQVIRKLVVTPTGGGSQGQNDPDRTIEIIPIKGVSGSDARGVIASITGRDTTPEADLLDTILACCECDEDTMIVHLRMKGHVDAEIGTQLGLSRPTIFIRRKEIERRFKQRFEDKYA